MSRLSQLLVVFVVFEIANLVESHQTQTKTYKYLIFTTQCYEKYFNEFKIENFFDMHCLIETAMKGLSYFLVAGGLILKLPQIIRIILDKSVYGVSFKGVVFEIVGAMLQIAYNLNQGNYFSLYGQNVFIGISNVTIVMLFLVYAHGSKSKYSITLIILFSAQIIFVYPQLIPSYIYQNCIWFQMLLFASARMSQILLIFKQKSTGSLSLLTAILQVGGNIARLSTILFDAGKDWRFQLALTNAIILNGTILVQFGIFWKNRHQSLKYEAQLKKKQEAQKKKTH